MGDGRKARTLCKHRRNTQCAVVVFVKSAMVDRFVILVLVVSDGRPVDFSIRSVMQK